MSLLKGIALLVTATLSLSISAQEVLVDELFPNAQLSKHLINADTELYISAFSRLESDGKKYVALTYYQPYPIDSSLRYVSYALLEQVGEKYEVRFDQVANDGAGSGSGHKEPFLYKVNNAKLIVFSTCYRGCGFTFYRIGTAPIQIPLAAYDGFDANESFNGRHNIYNFNESGLSIIYRVALTGDASCCLSGGNIEIFYELEGNRFEISKVNRSE